jgi:hypothetical protein
MSNPLSKMGLHLLDRLVLRAASRLTFFGDGSMQQNGSAKAAKFTFFYRLLAL